MSLHADGGHDAHDYAGPHPNDAHGVDGDNLVSEAHARVDLLIDRRSLWGKGARPKDSGGIGKSGSLQVVVHGLVYNGELELSHRIHAATRFVKNLEVGDMAAVDRGSNLNCPHQEQVDNARRVLGEKARE